MAPTQQDLEGSAPTRRLALLEALLACDSAENAARLGVDWLVRDAGVRHVFIALVDRASANVPLLVGVAAADPEAERVSADLDDGDHPLVQAMLAREPKLLSRAELSRAGVRFDGDPCTAHPLPWPTDSTRERVGVVLLGATSKVEELGWALPLIGRRLGELASLRARRSEGDQRRLRVAEAAVRAERERLDLIIDSVADPIIVTDARGGTIMTNPPAERLLRPTPDASSEERLRARGNDAQFSTHVAELSSLAPGGRCKGRLYLLDPETAASVPVEAISGKTVSGGEGEVTAVVTIFHDQTEALEKSALYDELKCASSLLEEKVKDATAELVRQNGLLHRQAIELEAASSARSQFLANMSHELRTPLNAILGYTSMLLEGVSGPLPANLTRQLTRIDSNGRHLLTIINDILDIARIESGKMPFHPGKFVVADLVKEVLAELEPLIVRSKLEVRFEVGKVVPILNTDRAKVKQVLVNLVSNALKFTPEGTVTVSAQWSKRTKDVWISVADTGIGIAEDDREAVFQEFRQVDNSPTRPYGGTGLGLAICRRLADLLGGKIHLASKLGKGSTFTLVLPTKPAVGAAAPAAQSTR